VHVSHQRWRTRPSLAHQASSALRAAWRAAAGAAPGAAQLASAARTPRGMISPAWHTHRVASWRSSFDQAIGGLCNVAGSARCRPESRLEFQPPGDSRRGGPPWAPDEKKLAGGLSAAVLRANRPARRPWVKAGIGLRPQVIRAHQPSHRWRSELMHAWLFPCPREGLHDARMDAERRRWVDPEAGGRQGQLQGTFPWLRREGSRPQAASRPAGCRRVRQRTPGSRPPPRTEFRACRRVPGGRHCSWWQTAALAAGALGPYDGREGAIGIRASAAHLQHSGGSSAQAQGHAWIFAHIRPVISSAGFAVARWRPAPGTPRS